MIKQAVILSAGLGARLYPITDTIPKPMIPILGKPLLEHHINQFKKHGVSEFFISLHYLPEVIRNYFGDGSKWGVKINYSFEPTPLGTAGGVKQFENQLDDTFFLIYGDIFSLVDYSKMKEVFTAKTDAIGMQRVGLCGYRSDVDLVELDSDNLFAKIHPKPHSARIGNPYSMRGIFILKRRILSYVPKGVYYEIGSQLLPDIVSQGEKFYGYECDEYSKGIDTLDKYEEVQNFYKENIGLI